MLEFEQKLDTIREEIMALITINTGIPVEDANASEEYKIYDLTTPTLLRHLPGDGKIHIISSEHIRYGFGRNPQLIQGFYNAEKGKILLNSMNCCFSTLIHETLHSISNFSRNYSILSCHEFPCEGFTELITGYIICGCADSLQMVLPNDCCQWWRPPRGCFLSRYRTDMIISDFITKKIGQKEFLSIYLDSKIENPIEELTNKIRDTGIDFSIDVWDFTKAIVGRRRIQEELTRCYGNDFTDFMRKMQPEFNITF